MISLRPFKGLLLALLALAISAVPGCQCSGSKTLARLIEQNGYVERDYATQVGRWEQAPMGAHFMLGDGVRANQSSDAVLELNEGSRVSLRPDTEIRFIQSQLSPSQAKSAQDPPEKTVGISVESGEISVVAGGERLQLATHIGMAILDAGSQVEIRKTERNIEFRVNIGRAVIRSLEEDPTGEADEEISAGEAVLINIGTAVLTRIEEPGSVAQPAPTGVMADNAAPEDTGTGTVSADTASDSSHVPETVPYIVSAEPMPTLADFHAPAGETFFVHVARPPVVVEIAMHSTCPDGGILRTGKKEWSFKGRNPRLVLGRGRTSYSLTCVDADGHKIEDSRIKGRAIVLRDAGVARLPGRAPPSYVDADGRLYKILYQNRLPQITINWPNAPKASQYKLEVSSGPRGSKQIRTDSPVYKFKTGSLFEGSHRVKFRTVGGSARSSKTTTIKLMFDNATPKASIKSPIESSFAAGATVHVQGIAAPGWQVESSDGALSVDRHNRFEGEIEFSGVYRSLSLRLFHRLRGVHYYLRRGKMR